MGIFDKDMHVLRTGCVLGALTLGGCDESGASGWPAAAEVAEEEFATFEGAPANSALHGAQADPGPGSLDLTDEQQRDLRAVAPNVVAWSQPHRGVFDGADERGIRFVVYGSEAREFYLQELAAKIDRLDERIGDNEDPEVAQTLGDERDALAHELHGHVESIAAAPATRMNSQELFHTIGSACGRIVYARSTFTHAWGSYLATTDASLPPLGSPPQFGPIAPPAISVYRYTYARVNEKSAYQEQTSGMAGQQSLSASSAKLVFPGGCSMETRHSVGATCSGGNYHFTALTTTQTCKGVANGEAPIAM